MAAPERLIVSALPSIARKLIIPNLGQLVSELPGVSLEIHATTAVESVESEVDVALRFGPGGWRGVESRFIAEEELIVVASPQYWQGNPPNSPEDLKGRNLITDRESSWRLWLEAAGLNADDFSSMLRVTELGIGGRRCGRRIGDWTRAGPAGSKRAGTRKPCPPV